MTVPIDYIDKKATIYAGKYKHIELCNTPGSRSRNQMFCHHCKGSIQFTYPMTIPFMTKIFELFETEHKNCEPKQ